MSQKTCPVLPKNALCVCFSGFIRTKTPRGFGGRTLFALRILPQGVVCYDFVFSLFFVRQA
ncbi:MAG: hypothetical protein LBS36_12700 [Oscillospiraceae bacterium]|jgi:hypothetical protein|nr:hypothetical protein [Oscillospiraceae bacterium]